jgi:hypothetical protein
MHYHKGGYRMRSMVCARRSVMGIVGVLGLFCFMGVAWADDFSADFVSKSNDPSRMPGKGKIYMKDQRMRMEHPQAVTISRPDKGVMWMLIPGQNMYVEQPYRPSPGLQKWSPEMESRARKVGTESVSGLMCTKYEIRGNQGTVHYWISEKIDFPVKMQDSGNSMLLENIKIGTVSGDLFEVPAGYRKFAMPSGGGGMPGRPGYPSKR